MRDQNKDCKHYWLGDYCMLCHELRPEVKRVLEELKRRPRFCKVCGIEIEDIDPEATCELCYQLGLSDLFP